MLPAGQSFALAAGEGPAGSIRTLKGTGQTQRGGTSLPATVGMPVYPLDVLTTAGDPALGIILYDDTAISPGPDSRLVLKEYIFEPHSSRFAAAFGFVKGFFAYLSGIIAILAPESLRLEPPSATIAVRDTRLLIKIDCATGQGGFDPGAWMFIFVIGTLCSACRPVTREMMVLIADPDGKVGRVEVASSAGRHALSEPDRQHQKPSGQPGRICGCWRAGAAAGHVGRLDGDPSPFAPARPAPSPTCS